MHEYDIDTSVSLMDFHGDMFSYIPQQFPDADTHRFIVDWMKSDSRAALDEGSPKLLYKSGLELLSWFVNQELSGKYPRGASDYQPHVLHWVGLMYQLYCYEEKITSAQLVDILPPDVLYSMYYPWHELSDLGAVKRIKKYLLEEAY